MDPVAQTMELQVLDLLNCNYDPHNLTESLKDLFINCTHLTELNIGMLGSGCVNELLDPQFQAIVDNLTPTILKVDFGARYNLQDEHVKKLVNRCNKITHLDLICTSITNDSVHSIIEQLKASLEELDVSDTHVDFATLLRLKSMPALKTLICLDDDQGENIENLKQQLPHIRINEEEDKDIIAEPFAFYPFKIDNDESSVNDWIWEIRAKEQDLFW